MLRLALRGLIWIAFFERPRTGPELVAAAALPALVLLCLAALAWPWLTEDAPRIIAAGAAVLQGWLASALGRLWTTLAQGWPG
jgi:hypothetical protein